MIAIGDYLYQCPQVWKNYIKATNPHGELKDEEVDEITLKVWKGKFIKLKRGGYVEFETESDEIMFMLRWG